MSQTTTTTNPTPKAELIDAPSTNANSNSKRLINLLRGWPSPQLLPPAQLRAAADYVLSDPAISTPVLQYGIDPGYQPLREELAGWLASIYKYQPGDGVGAEGGGDDAGGQVGIKADEIAISGGASQSLACILQSFTDPGYTRAVWVVAPCYFMGCPIFEDSGFRGRLRAVPEDEGGIDLGALEKGLREEEGRVWEGKPFKHPYPDRKLYRHVIYLVATCANPSGKTLSLARREQLVRLAREYDALIISDDVYDLLQWPVTSSLPSATEPLSLLKDAPLPLLSQIDIALGPTRHDPPGKHFSHAISNASFSKLVGPGVRTGWIHATADFAYGFSQTGTNRSGGAASQFAAAVVWRMMSTGYLQRHLDCVVRPALRRRHALVVGEVERVLRPLGLRAWGANGVGGAGTTTGKGEGSEGGEVFGGYFVWLTLPEGLDAKAVAERAKEEEALIVAPGWLFEVAGDEDGARFPRNVRLSFSWADEEDIVEGVARLGSVLRRMLDGQGLRAEGKGEEIGEAEFK